MRAAELAAFSRGDGVYEHNPGFQLAVSRIGSNLLARDTAQQMHQLHPQ